MSLRLPLFLVSSLLGAQTLRIPTSQYDNMRTGANSSESVLTPKNVNTRQFGKIWALPVDGDVYAQPLYLSQVDVPGKGIHNLLFIATEHDSVYAFDADDRTAKPIWHVSLLSPSREVETPLSAGDVQCPFISPEIGVTSTPIIDPATGTIYVLARSKRPGGLISGPRYFQRLHALAITTGKEKAGGPVEIRASVPGIGEGNSAGKVEFDSLRENPRAALLLTKGVVYATWASSCDVSPYHGWVLAYDSHTLKQLAAFNTSPNAGESGIWQSDTGPAADNQGNVYLSTGNGHFDAASGRSGLDYGDTLLKLHRQGSQLAVAGYFTPYDQQELNSTDGDLGSGGPLLIPDNTHEHATGLVFGGKAGFLYDVDPNRLPGFERDQNDPAVERIRLSNGIYGAPAYWNGHLYYFGSEDSLKEFRVTHGRLQNAPSSQSLRRSRFSGGTPTVSANGTKNGIVWIVETRAWDRGGNQAALRAYDALNVSRELYSSTENSHRDAAGEALRFASPVVANGRVYVGARMSVTVYGLLPH